MEDARQRVGVAGIISVSITPQQLASAKRKVKAELAHLADRRNADWTPRTGTTVHSGEPSDASQ